MEINNSGVCAEIVVVDNNQEDILSETVRRQSEMAGDKRVRYVQERSPGLTAARHRGAEVANGELLVFLDDDVIVAEGWLQALSDGFSDSSVGIAGGPSIPRFAGAIPSWFWDFIEPTEYGGWFCHWLSIIDIGKSIESVNPNYIWGLNFGIRKKVLEELGGFNIDIVPKTYGRWQGDGETGLTKKAASRGVRAKYLQGAMLFHIIGPERMTPEYFVKRAYFQGICDSYSAVRAGRTPEAKEAIRSIDTRVSSASLIKGSRYYFRRLRDALSYGRPRHVSRWEDTARDLKQRAAEARHRGFLAHQNTVAVDPRLLVWSRRDHYRDADLRQELASYDSVPASFIT
jgi:glycosyltransferase involved in cell wall biosynthesis